MSKLVDEYNNTYPCTIEKKPIDVDYSTLAEKLCRIVKHLNLKLAKESGLLSTRIFLEKYALKIGQEKYLSFILRWKLILGRIKWKINEEKKQELLIKIIGGE